MAQRCNAALMPDFSIKYPIHQGRHQRALQKLLKFGERYRMDVLSRCTAHNLRQDGRILNYPLYCVDHFPNWTANLASPV